MVFPLETSAIICSLIVWNSLALFYTSMKSLELTEEKPAMNARFCVMGSMVKSCICPGNDRFIESDCSR
jgi:hypothetical protein